MAEGGSEGWAMHVDFIPREKSGIVTVDDLVDGYVLAKHSLKCKLILSTVHVIIRLLERTTSRRDGFVTTTYTYLATDTLLLVLARAGFRG